MRRRNLLTWAVVAVAAVTLSCGSEGPSSPSGTGVEVQGLLLGEGASFVASSGAHPSAAKAEKVVVTVEGTTITTEVSANGTFVLKGIPGGSFTLIFTVGGTEIGRIDVLAEDGAEVKVVVKVENGLLVLVELQIENPEPGASASPSPAACVISGGKQGEGIELEGVVASGGNFQNFDMTVNGERASGLVHVSAGAASYRCIGGAKVDSDDACKALIALGGAKVHVRGRLEVCSPTEAQVTAFEVKIQKD
ncbi:MAG TPA: hypothetical protein VLL75_10615 [Vicinamibacteria bacterium]|nr:hypothetical protein [Vicinamibacteria bacterium]